MWGTFCRSRTLQNPFFGFVWGCVVKWTRKVKALSAHSKFSAFSPADLQTGIPQWCVFCLSPGSDACAVREYSDKVLPLVTAGSLKWEVARVQDARLLPWLICCESCHPQKSPTPPERVARCRRPPCWEKARQVRVL